MSPLGLMVLCLLVVAQTLLAQPLGAGTQLGFYEGEDGGYQDVGDYSEEDSSLEELLSEDLTDEDLDKAVVEILSRSRRGLRSKLKRAWKKHIRPVVRAVVTAHIVKAVAPAIAVTG